MESALIISSTDVGVEIIVDILRSISCKNVLTTKTGSEARKLALEHKFDLYIINSSSKDNCYENLVFELNTNNISQILLIVKNDIYKYVSGLFEELGVVTISKPLNMEILLTSLKLLKATSIKLKTIQKKNDILSQQIEDIKFVDRAKFILITHLNMSETEAHKYIEREAMNTRSSKRHVAENILKTYDF